MLSGNGVVNDPTGVSLRDSGDMILISLDVPPAVLHHRLMARGFSVGSTASSLLCTLTIFGSSQASLVMLLLSD
jgi:hypothetical protein